MRREGIAKAIQGKLAGLIFLAVGAAEAAREKFCFKGKHQKSFSREKLAFFWLQEQHRLFKRETCVFFGAARTASMFKRETSMANLYTVFWEDTGLQKDTCLQHTLFTKTKTYQDQIFLE